MGGLVWTKTASVSQSYEIEKLSSKLQFNRFHRQKWPIMLMMKCVNLGLSEGSQNLKTKEENAYLPERRMRCFTQVLSKTFPQENNLNFTRKCNNLNSPPPPIQINQLGSYGWWSCQYACSVLIAWRIDEACSLCIVDDEGVKRWHKVAISTMHLLPSNTNRHGECVCACSGVQCCIRA